MATQNELAWINANKSLAQSQFGSLNPPDGQVAKFIGSWYNAPEQRNEVPDDIDGPILKEFGIQTPNAWPGANTPAGQAIKPANQNTQFDATLYARVRPDLVTNWQNSQNPAYANDPNVAYIKQFPTLDAYLQNDFNNDPAGNGAKVAQLASQTGTGSNTGNGVDFTKLVSGAPATATTVPGGGNFNQSTTGAQAGDYASQGSTNQTQIGNQFQQTLESQQQHQQGTSSLNSNEQQLSQQQQLGTTTGFQNGQTAQNQQGSTTGFENGTTAQQQVGNTVQNQVGATSGTTVGNETGRQLGQTNQSTVGTTVDNTTGTQHNVGTSNVRTEAITPFDIQSLIEKQLPQTAASDAARNSYLTDFMNTGGTAFNSQVDQAIRGSLTGPQMTGAGDSARARAAGYGAAQVARQNADQRLSAALQLAGPTGLGTLTQQSAPLFGSNVSANTVNDITSNNTTTGRIRRIRRDCPTSKATTRLEAIRLARQTLRRIRGRTCRPRASRRTCPAARRI